MLIVAIAGIVACTVRPARGKCRSCAGGCLACCLCPLLVLMLVMWFFGALFFFIAVLGSDFCYDPAAVILSGVGSGNTAAKTATYYISPCGSVATDGVYLMLQSALLRLVSACAAAREGGRPSAACLLSHAAGDHSERRGSLDERDCICVPRC